MTKEEAIDTLKAFKAMLKIYPKRRKQKETVVQLETALDMAIKSLKTDGCKDAFRAMFAESAEAYKAWTGEEMGKTHGRLIDADALKIKIEEELYSNDYEEHIYQIIDNAPTVSADRPTMTEEVREALMRLTMCAREECDMCKYEHNRKCVQASRQTAW